MNIFCVKNMLGLGLDLGQQNGRCHSFFKQSQAKLQIVGKEESRNGHSLYLAILPSGSFGLWTGKFLSEPEVD